MRNVIYVRRKGRLHPRPVRLYILSFFIFLRDERFTTLKLMCPMLFEKGCS